MFIVNGEIWRIKLVRPDYPLLMRPDGTFSIGVCDDNYKVICISNQLHGRIFQEVLCHEIVHAAMFSYNIFLDHDTEELVANIFAKYGYEIINLADTMFRKIKMGIPN